MEISNKTYIIILFGLIMVMPFLFGILLTKTPKARVDNQIMIHVTTTKGEVDIPLGEAFGMLSNQITTEHLEMLKILQGDPNATTTDPLKIR